MEAVRQIKTGAGRTACRCIGFAGAPFTMMTYAVEGGGSKDYDQTRHAVIGGDPPAAHALLEKLVDTTRGVPGGADRRRRRRGAAVRQLGRRAVSPATSASTRCATRAR
jgi:hypothetical protein